MTNRRLRLLPLFALFWVFPSCIEVKVYSSSTASVAVQARDTIAVFPPPDGPVLARVRQLALSADEKSVYILDAHPAVHRIDLDGVLLASFGREGKGPGELTRPIAIQAAREGGVWVLERRHAIRYRSDGSVAETLVLTNLAASTFAPVGDGEVVIPALSAGPPDRLLVRLGPDGVEELANPPRVPSTLSGGDRFVGWKLAPLGIHDVAIVLNGPDLLGWRAYLGDDSQAIDSLVELAMPPMAHRVIAEESRRSAIPDARPNPLWRAGVAANRLWVVSTGLPNGPVAFSVPLREGETSLHVPAEPGFHDRDHRIRDMIVLPDRIVIARDIEVVILEAHTPPVAPPPGHTL